jgi:antitoxin (DNA-binding transcriptional repressor) of toxin-antitoxin stability system
MMKKAKIAELKNQLSKYIHQVKRGNTVMVLERDTPVAMITPTPTKKTSAQLWDLVKEGKASWDGGKPAGLEPGLPVRGRLSEEILREIRDESD